jgi:gamma-glutamyltranspeptidase/glutathione hydrolase
LSNGEVPEEGTIIKNPALASMLDYLANVERAANGSRSSKIAAARDAFYRGDVAREIATFSQERDGLLDRKDLSV